jgi:hypothetical protein
MNKRKIKKLNEPLVEKSAAVFYFTRTGSNLQAIFCAMALRVFLFWELYES